MWRKSLIFLMFFMACNSGPENKIKKKKYMVALVQDNFDSDAIFLSSMLADTFYTPFPDPVFTIDPYHTDQFEQDAGYRYVIILSTPEVPSYAYFKLAFPDKGAGLFVRRNVFARGDYIVGLNAPKISLMHTYIERYKDSIFNLLMDNYKKELRKVVYFIGKNKWMIKEISRDYPFTVQIPGGWTYIQKDSIILKKRDFLAITKHYPERFMFFYMSPVRENVSPAEIMDIRDSLARLYYNGDSLQRGSMRAKKFKFKGLYNAYKLIGVWSNDKEFTGGPCEIIAFNTSSRFFMIDMGVFAPEKRRKSQYLLRMEIIAASLNFK